MMSKWIGSVKSISLQEPTKKKPLFCSELLFSANWTHKNTTVVSRNFPLSRSTENRPLGTDKHQKTNLLLQPEQLQNAPKISCATSLREREGDLRMRSLFASNHQSSRTDAIKSCPNIATDPRSLYPGPHPHLSLKLLFLLYEFHCSSGVLYLLVSIRRRALLVGGRRGGIGMVMSWKQHLVRSSRLLLNAAARRTTIHEVLFFSFLFVRSVFVSSCVLCQSEFANSYVSFPLHLVSVEAWTCIDSNRGRGTSPLFYAVGACSSFALLSLARFPLSLEFLIHLSYLQLGKVYARLLSVCVCVFVCPSNFPFTWNHDLATWAQSTFFWMSDQLRAIILSQKLNTKQKSCVAPAQKKSDLGTKLRSRV